MRIPGLVLSGALAVVHLAPPCPASAQTSPPPHARSHRLLDVGDAAAAGVILVATMAADKGLREEIQEHRDPQSNSVADVGNAFGEPRYVVPALGAAYLAGELAGTRALRRLAVRAGGAALVASGITGVLKYTFGRSRPSEGDADWFRPFSGQTSFPSGHTTVAFALATVVADETRDDWSDVGVYGLATLTAFARLNDDRHWTSDVVLGALIGHLSARWLSRRQGAIAVGPGFLGMALEF